MADRRQQVVTYLDAPELGSARRVGTLSRERSGSKSVISFAYDPGWLAARRSFVLDPQGFEDQPPRSEAVLAAAVRHHDGADPELAHGPNGPSVNGAGTEVSSWRPWCSTRSPIIRFT